MPKKEDKWLFIIVLLIGLFGIIMIYSASYIWADYKYHDPFKYLKTQSFFYILSSYKKIYVINSNYESNEYK